jgi:hypothetical protein
LERSARWKFYSAKSSLFTDYSGLGGGALHIEKYNGPDFVFIQIEPNVKTKSLFSGCESLGYRLFCQDHNISYFYRLKKMKYSFNSSYHLGSMKIREKLSKSFSNLKNIPLDVIAEPIVLRGSELLCPERFDIAIKCHYGRLWKIGAGETWRKYLYYEHILRLTGSLRIKEWGNSNKEGYKTFLNVFNGMLEDIPSQDFPDVPIDRNLVALNGSHRIAAAIVYRRPVHCIRIDAAYPFLHFPTAAFFQSRIHGFEPCPEVILDEAAIEYCRLKRGLAIALIFPTVADDTYAINCLKNLGKIVYYKNILLSPKAGGGLLRQVYLGHAWFDNCSDDSGFIHKQKSCFPFTGPTRAVLIDDFTPDQLRVVKDQIRNAMGVGNHSIHITDSDEETLRVARVVFNRNSIELLEMGIGNLPLFHHKLSKYRTWMKEAQLNEECFCIDGSAVLALLGLRECRDLDFLYHGDPSQLPESPSELECHNAAQRYYDLSIAEIVGDARMHCWYMGIKFCTPFVVLRMKEKRCEQKDKIDAALLKTVIPANKYPLFIYWKSKIYLVYAYWRAKAALVLDLLKSPLRRLLRILRNNMRHP